MFCHTPSKASTVSTTCEGNNHDHLPVPQPSGAQVLPGHVDGAGGVVPGVLVQVGRLGHICNLPKVGSAAAGWSIVSHAQDGAMGPSILVQVGSFGHVRHLAGRVAGVLVSFAAPRYHPAGFSRPTSNCSQDLADSSDRQTCNRSQTWAIVSHRPCCIIASWPKPASYDNMTPSGPPLSWPWTHEYPRCALHAL